MFVALLSLSLPITEVVPLEFTAWYDALRTYYDMYMKKLNLDAPCTCVEECLKGASAVFDLWNDLDDECKWTLYNVDVRWRDDRMRRDEMRAMRFCRKNRCVITDGYECNDYVMHAGLHDTVRSHCLAAPSPPPYQWPGVDEAPDPSPPEWRVNISAVDVPLKLIFELPHGNMQHDLASLGTAIEGWMYDWYRTHVVDCTSSNCYLSTPADAVATLCDAFHYGELKDLLLYSLPFYANYNVSEVFQTIKELPQHPVGLWEAVGELDVDLQGCDAHALHRRAPVDKRCVEECAMEVRISFSFWNELDIDCKWILYNIDTRWREDYMRMEARKARRFCRQGYCTGGDIFRGIQDGLDDAVHAHCSPRARYYAALETQYPSAGPPGTPPPPYQWPEVDDNRWRKIRAASRKQPAEAEAVWHGAVIAAVLLSSVSLGCHLRAARRSPPPRAPFAMRVAKKRAQHGAATPV